MNTNSIRQKLEVQEKSILAPWALHNINSKGRHTPETKDEYRLNFARDRDRIIHTKAFRRLKGKTQVFVAHYGDHYRSRLTHSLEVAQIARTIARILGANEDVCEAVALAHDIGHTPFGHAGQDALSKKLRPYGISFEHNAQSRRILEVLEPQNLSIEILQCLCKHPTKTEQKEYNLSPQNSIEGQIVDIADAIAYSAHDLQDGLQSGLLNKTDFNFLPDNILDVMVRDIVEYSSTCLQIYKTTEEVQNAQNPIIQFSPEFLPTFKTLRNHLFQKLYKHDFVVEQMEKGEKIISDIFDILEQDQKKIPHDFQISNPHHIRIKDFIAGMTDNFAVEFLES